MGHGHAADAVEVTSGLATLPRRGGIPLWAAEALAACVLIAPLGLALAVQARPPLVPVAIAVIAWIVWRDATRYLIPDAAVVALGVVALTARLREPLFAFDASLATLSMLLDGLLAGGGVWLVREAYFRRRGHDGIGLGDVKLAAVGGLLCGIQGFSLVLLAASLAGLAGAFMALRLGFDEIGRKFPFGAVLAPAILLAWIIQP